MNFSIDPMYGENAELRAERRIHEPTGMTRDELLEWYMEQPLPFRRRNTVRIGELSRALMVEAVLTAAAQIGA